MSSEVKLKAAGLQTAPNVLNGKEGGLLEAVNVVSRRRDVIEKRRGFNLYGTSFGSANDRAKQLLVYKGRLLRHYNSILQYDTNTTNVNDEKVFDSFNGSYTEPQSNLKIKSAESNGNFYFTTSNGIKKISATSASQFTTAANYITSAGGIKALDVTPRLKVTLGDQSSFFTQDSKVAYRVVFNKYDANNNRIEGFPSYRQEISNPLIQLLLRDFANLLAQLDNVSYQTGSIIDDANYISTLLLPITSNGSSLRTNLIALVEKLDKERGTLFSSSQVTSAAISGNLCTVTVSATIGIYGKISVGDKVYLTGFSTSNGQSLDGVQTVTAVTATTFSFVTTATGTVSLVNESVEAGEFRSYTQPGLVSSTQTNQELVALQTYLNNIITELQSSRYYKQIAVNTGAATNNPLEITTVAVSGGNTLTINFDAAGDARDHFIAGDKFTLAGTWTGAGAENLTTLFLSYTVATVAATNITATVSGITNGAVTIDSTSVVNFTRRFTSSTQSTFLNNLDITTTASVLLDITIPPTADTNTQLQIYRTEVVSATGAFSLSDIASAGDEMGLVYEDYLTSSQITAKTVTINDITLDIFRGANLYTNENTGETFTQANDIPPLALDITLFKERVWYANTQTYHKLLLTLLGTTNLLSEYDAGRTPQVTITTEDNTYNNTYNFVKGIQESTNFNTVAAASLASSSTASYFLLYNAQDYTPYYVWYKLGTSTDPAISGKTGIIIYINSGDTNTQVATKTKNTLASYIQDFTSSTNGSNTVTVTNVDIGYTTDASAGTSGFTSFSITQGVGERATQEITELTFPAGSTFTTSAPGQYFTINTGFDRIPYYVWFNVDSTNTDPSIANKTGIQVAIASGDTNTQVATKVNTTLSGYSTSFTTSINSNIVTVTNVQYGPTTNATVGTMPGGFSISVTQEGLLQVALYPTSIIASPAQSVDLTARSFVRIINKNSSSGISAFYLSDVNDTPGQMFFEAQNFSTETFYIIANKGTGSIEIGDSFSPVITPTHNITGISMDNPTVVTSTAHGLLSTYQIMIGGTNSTPTVNGVYEVTVPVTGANTFTIPVNVTSSGNAGGWTLLTDTLNIVKSNNDRKPNRLYYSKLQQPEAVPTLNYYDIGSQDQAILRIIALRDTLLVYKEDGLFRLIGQDVPFTRSVYDGTVKLLCPDSVALLNNQVYGWTEQGIEVVNESNIETYSIPIDIDIKTLASYPYTNFKTITWGIGYDSDNTYQVYTVKNTTDTIPQQAYVYNLLTEQWFKYDISATCGVVNPSNDLEYLGDGTENYILQERKNFNRTDYVDKQYNTILNVNNYLSDGQYIILPSVIHVEENDVLSQIQYLTLETFNSLLDKLDLDPGVNDTTYASLLSMSAGGNLRTSLISCAQKLDVDTGVSDTDYASTIGSKSGSITSHTVGSPTVITSASHGLFTGRYVTITSNTSTPSLNGTYQVTVLTANTFSIPVNTLVATSTGTWVSADNDFRDIQVCYNKILTKLDLDSTVSFTNYYSHLQSNGTVEWESVINNVNTVTKMLTLNTTHLPFIQGNMIIYKSFESYFSTIPNHFGDPVYTKHLRNSQLYFENFNFTRATLSFLSDLIPSYSDIPITGQGIGSLGFNSFGNGYFGGITNTPPFITYIPRNYMRCRYLRLKFTHNVAREGFAILGLSITGNINISERAYK